MARLWILTPAQHRADNDDGDRPPPIARARAQQARPLDEGREVWGRGRDRSPTALLADDREIAATLRHAA